LLALQDETDVRLVARHVDRIVEQRLVGDDPARLQSAGRRDDQLRSRVVDARRQFVRGKAAEHHRMHRADAGAGQHRYGGFRHHRHIDDDAVALADTLVAQHRGQRHHLALELGIGELADGAGDRAVVDERDLVGASARYVTIDGIEAGVAGGAVEPAAVDAGIRVEHGVVRREPVYVPGGFGPEPLRVAPPAVIDLMIA